METPNPEVAPTPAPTPVEPAPVVEAPAPAPTPAAPASEPSPAPTPTAAPEQTVAEILKTDDPAPEAAPKLVPEAALINEKKGRKDAERKLKDLQTQIASGATQEEVSGDIDAILEEFGLDDTNKQFFNKLAKSLTVAAEKKAEEKFAGLRAPEEAAQRQQKIDAAFDAAFKDAIERNPEYDGIAVPAVIKAMSLLPDNANKTFSQILEDSYGSSIQGKRTIETVVPGGPKEPQPIDYAKASSDQQYFETIMANPVMKAEYNKGLARRIRL